MPLTSCSRTYPQEDGRNQTPARSSLLAPMDSKARCRAHQQRAVEHRGLHLADIGTVQGHPQMPESIADLAYRASRVWQRGTAAALQPVREANLLLSAAQQGSVGMSVLTDEPGRWSQESCISRLSAEGWHEGRRAAVWSAAHLLTKHSYPDCGVQWQYASAVC